MLRLIQESRIEMKVIEREMRLELKSYNDLEDVLYFEVDKLLALCMASRALEENEISLPLDARANYSRLVEEQVRQLRSTLDAFFAVSVCKLYPQKARSC